MLWNIQRPILLTAALLGLSACAKNSSSFCECDSESLPVPEKVVRSRMGFIPEKVEVSIDLTKGQVNYSRNSKINADDSCEGSISIQDQVDQWKQASRVSVCYGEKKNPVSDGTLDTITLYYSQSQELPEGVKTRIDGEWKTVTLFDRLNDSVMGPQQFDCTGNFALDALIVDKVSCLKVE